MKSTLFGALGAAALTLELFAAPASAEPTSDAKRTVVYHQTQYHNDAYM
ncbi:hypothetical protein [Herbihabitans rhizosphaerae]|nr:hypothetical protein [Herbihabitans rhizosphaerae]